MVDAAGTLDAETKLAGFFANYPPPIAKLGKALRTRLRARLPGLHELVYVYERQQALVLSYSPTEGGADGVCGLGIYPDGVKLFFGQGARLAKADPGRLLRGSGKTVRHVVIEALADYERPALVALLVAAVQLAKVRLDPQAEGAVVFKAGAKAERSGKATKGSRANVVPPKPARRAAKPAAKKPAVGGPAATKRRAKRPAVR